MGPYNVRVYRELGKMCQPVDDILKIKEPRERSGMSFLFSLLSIPFSEGVDANV